MNTPKKQYLGDSVYADFDGFDIILTTENGDEPRSVIILVPEVMTALERYVKGLRNESDPKLDNPHVAAFAAEKEKHSAKINTINKFADALLEAGVPRCNPNCEGFSFFSLTHEQIIAAIRIFGGKWTKKLSEGQTIDYWRDEPIDGLPVKIYWGEPPPSCKIVEEEVEVPEQVIPAHKEKVRRMVCKEGV